MIGRQDGRRVAVRERVKGLLYKSYRPTRVERVCVIGRGWVASVCVWVCVCVGGC